MSVFSDIQSALVTTIGEVFDGTVHNRLRFIMRESDFDSEIVTSVVGNKKLNACFIYRYSYTPLKVMRSHGKSYRVAEAEHLFRMMLIYGMDDENNSSNLLNEQWELITDHFATETVVNRFLSIQCVYEAPRAIEIVPAMYAEYLVNQIEAEIKVVRFWEQQQ